MVEMSLLILTLSCELMSATAVHLPIIRYQTDTVSLRAMAATVRMITTGGKVIITSVTRMITLSTRPPKKPAIEPRIMPIVTEIATATSPTASDTRPA